MNIMFRWSLDIEYILFFLSNVCLFINWINIKLEWIDQLIDLTWTQNTELEIIGKRFKMNERSFK